MMLTDKISGSLDAAAPQVCNEIVSLIGHRPASPVLRVERIVADTIEVDWGIHLPPRVLQLEETNRP